MSERREEFAVGGPITAIIRIPAGGVVVREAPEGTAGVILTGARAEDVDVSFEAGILTVVQDPRRLVDRSVLQAEVQLPPESEITIRTASAAVRCLVRVADARIESASGAVEIASAAAADVKTASGDISADHVDDRIRARTASGDVYVATMGRGGVIVSASGNVRVDRGFGDLNIKTASGDVVVGQFDGTSMTAKTVSADVRVGVPTGRTLVVDLQTLSGDVRLPSEPDPTEGRAGPRLRIRAKTISGDVVISLTG